MGEHGSEASRWLLGVLLVGLLGWTTFTVYERVVARPSASSSLHADTRVDAFVARARDSFIKGDYDAAIESYHKASGVDDNDSRVLEGLALVEVARAEQMWWQITFGRYDEEQRRTLVRKLDDHIRRSRTAVKSALSKLTDTATSSRLRIGARRTDAMLVVALALHGDAARANAELAAQLGDHPQKQLLKDFVSMVGKARPTADDMASAEVDEHERPPLAGSARRPSRRARLREHYEFESEPSKAALPSAHERVPQSDAEATADLP